MYFRILRMIATSGFLTALECSKFAPWPTSWFKGVILLKGRGREGMGEENKERGEENRGGKGGQRKWEGPAPFSKILDAPLLYMAIPKCGKPNQSIGEFWSGLSSDTTARATMGVTVKEMSQDNVWEWLLEQSVFQLLLKSRQRIGRRDIVRQPVTERCCLQSRTHRIT